MIITVIVFCLLNLFIIGPILLLGGGKIVKLGKLSYTKAFRVNILSYFTAFLLLIITLPFRKLCLVGESNTILNIIIYILLFLFEILIIKLIFKSKLLQSLNINIMVNIGSFFLTFLITTFIFKSYCIPASSMEPAILKGDYIIVNHLYGNFQNPKRGDIVTFIPPQKPKAIWVKRIVGLGGEVIEIRNNQVFINDKPLIEKHKTSESSSRSIRNYGPKKIPENMYFVMGDNRDNSYDSRHFGFVPRDNIIGSPSFVYFSYNGLNKKINWNRITKTIK